VAGGEAFMGARLVSRCLSAFATNGDEKCGLRALGAARHGLATRKEL